MSFKINPVRIYGEDENAPEKKEECIQLPAIESVQPNNSIVEADDDICDYNEIEPVFDEPPKETPPKKKNSLYGDASPQENSTKYIIYTAMVIGLLKYAF